MTDTELNQNILRSKNDLWCPFGEQAVSQNTPGSTTAYQPQAFWNLVLLLNSMKMFPGNTEKLSSFLYVLCVEMVCTKWVLRCFRKAAEALMTGSIIAYDDSVQEFIVLKNPASGSCKICVLGIFRYCQMISHCIKYVIPFRGWNCMEIYLRCLIIH